MEVQIPENWQWNNGKYWFYYHSDNGVTETRTIDLFNSREAQNDFGHFIIDNKVIVSGKMLDATDRESGKQLLIDYVKKFNNQQYKYCEGCDESVIELFYDNRINGLCHSCNEVYDNKTGHCSLSCCMGNGCDETC